MSESTSDRENSPEAWPAVSAVRWNELFPWLLVLRAVRVSLLARVLLLAVLGVLATQAGWKAIELTVGVGEGDTPLATLTGRPAPSAMSLVRSSPPAAEADLQVEQAHGVFESVDSQWFSGPLVRGWAWFIQPLTRLYDADSWRAWFRLHLAGLWTIAAWAFFGGAICRIAAVYLARGEVIGPLEAVKSAAKNWVATAGAPAGSYALIALVAIPVLLAGVLLRIDLLALLVGAVWIVAIVGGLVVAVVGLGLLLGWPLMWSTVAVEQTDGFDAVSRGYAYLYQRPLHATFLVLLATALGLVAQAVLGTFVDASLEATRWLAGVGAGQTHATAILDGVEAPSQSQPEAGPALKPAGGESPAAGGDDSTANREKEDSEELAGGQAVGAVGQLGGAETRFWCGVFAWIAACYPAAFLWPVAVAGYLLLRRQIDATDLDEVSLEGMAPQRSLPPLAVEPSSTAPLAARTNDAAPQDAN
jgi:hypothetical protein